MTIEQTVEIPANHRLTLDVPREIPAGRAVLTFTPVPADLRSDDTMLMSEASLARDWNTPEENAA